MTTESKAQERADYAAIAERIASGMLDAAVRIPRDFVWEKDLLGKEPVLE